LVHQATLNYQENMNKLLQLTSLAAVITAVVSVANAAPVGLGDLIRNNGSIVHGDKIFSDFFFASNLGTHLPNDATVTISNTGSTYFLTLQGPFVSQNGQPCDISFFYTVATTSGRPLLTAIDQAFVLSAAGTGGTILIGETVRDGGFSGQSVAQSSLSFVTGDSSFDDFEDPATEPLTGDQLVINPTLAKVWVTKDIFFLSNAGGLIGPTTIIQSFHQVGIPDGGSTVVLLGVALSGIGLMRRRLGA